MDARAKRHSRVSRRSRARDAPARCRAKRGEARMKARPRKAMLLAAGKGPRLKPLTETVAKCMIEIGGKPVLEHNIVWLRKYGVTDILINLHYLAEAVMNYFGDGSRFGVRLKYSYEEELLGTAGAVKKVESFFDAPFL